MLLRIAESTWGAVLSAAPWILFGLLVAGFLYVYLPGNFVRAAMGGNSFGAVFRAALVGAPLPLCSCGVIPTSLYLRKEGAGRGPVLSFLISTPETNVDSVALTWAMMGPLMAVARPVAAVFSAVTAGVGEKLFGGEDPHAEKNGECGCRICEARPAGGGGGRGGVLGALKYGAIVLMRDLAPWLVVGLVLAGVIGGLVPENFFQDHNLGSGLLPMLLIVLLATPMYMCATASTPIAAALVAKGVSPGAALVFLLVGPATNVATMTAVGRFLGRRSLFIYLLSMVGTSLVLGLGLDAFAGDRITRAVTELAHVHHGSSWMTYVVWGSTALFLLLVANGLRLRVVPYWLAWRQRRAGAKPVPTAAEAGAEAGAPAACCAADAPPAAAAHGVSSHCEDASCGCEADAGSDHQTPEKAHDSPQEGGDAPESPDSECPHCRGG
ncbi:MAG: SO_0444 family Cu/Zn efflux transporter [Planctomycetota bacterium]